MRLKSLISTDMAFDVNNANKLFCMFFVVQSYSF